MANWWLAIPDQEAQVCGRGPSNIVLALNPCLMTWRKGPVNEASFKNLIDDMIKTYSSF